MLIGLPKQLAKLNSPILHMSSDVTILPIDAVRNLGVAVEAKLTLVILYMLTYLNINSANLAVRAITYTSRSQACILQDSAVCCML